MDFETETGDEGDNGEEVPAEPSFALIVLFEAGLAPLSLLIGWAFGLHPLADLAWDVKAVLAGLAAALPMIAVFAAGYRWPIGPLRGLRTVLQRSVVPLIEGCEWPDLALISVSAGIGEEMLFRGVLQALLVRLLGPVAGLVVTSLLFGLLHPISLAYAVMAGLLGAYLGTVWLVSGNLLTPMVTHAVYDFVALLILLRGSAAIPNPP